MPKKIITFVIVLVLGVSAYFYFQSEEPEGARSGGFPPAAVRVSTVTSHTFLDKIEALGTGQANEAVELTASTTDKVAKINFTDGMNVNKSDIIIELVHDEETAAVKAADANLKEQKRELDRIRNLVETRTLPTARLDAQKTLHEKAVAELRQANARLADRIIRAPFDGVLGFRQVSVGSLVAPGSVITTIDDLSVIKVDFTVPEVFLASLKVGQAVNAYLDAYKNRIFKGIVTTINTRVDATSRAVMVRAEIPNSTGEIRPGMLLKVELIKDVTDSLAVPEEAIVAQGKSKYVFVVGEDNKVSRNEVQLGRRIAGIVEVTSGVKGGMTVVSEGTMKLRHGMGVNIVSHKEFKPEDAANNVAKD